MALFKAERHTWKFIGSYDWINATIGLVPNDWVDESNAGCYGKIIGNKGGHTRVLECYGDGSGVYIVQERGSEFPANSSYGTIDLWIMTDNNALYSRISFETSGGTRAFSITIDGGNIRFTNAIHNVMEAIANYTWTHIKLDFERTVGGYLGLAQNKCQVRVNDTNDYGPYNFHNNVDPDQFYMVCGNNDNVFTWYSGIGLYIEDTGIDGYTPGDNIDEVIEDITADIITAKINEELYTVSYGEITVKGDILSYDPGHEIDFYDSDDVLSWTGIILSPEYTLKGTSEYISKIKMIGIDSQFENIYRKNYTTVRDSDYIAKHIIDNFLTKYHSYGSLIDNFTITYKYDMKKNILKMWYYLAMLERGVIHQLPDGEIFFNKYDNLTIIDKKYYRGSGGVNYETVGDKASLDEIDWVDGKNLYNGEAEIIAEWQNHKKVLRLQGDVDVGEYPFVYHNITQATSETFEYYVGHDDVTGQSRVYLYEGGVGEIIVIRISGDQLQYLDRASAWQNIANILDNILYHVKIIWRVDNTFDLYLDRVKEVDNQQTSQAQVSGIERIYFRYYNNVVDYIYLDAPGLVGESDPKGYVYVEGDNLYSYLWIRGITDYMTITKYIPSANRHITRAPVIGGYNDLGQVYYIGVGSDKVAEEEQFGIKQLQTWRDPQITNYTEAKQLGDNLQAIYSEDTQFIHILTQGKGHLQVGNTLALRSTDVFIIDTKEFLILRRVWDPTTDVSQIVITDNILPEKAFNARAFQKFYDSDAQIGYEDSDVAESTMDGTVLTLKSLSELRSL